MSTSVFPDGEAVGTLAELFTAGLHRHGDRVALIADGETVTYGEVCARADALAAGLERLGIRPGTAVAIAMSNGVDYVVADQAILRCGAVKVPLNDMLSPRDIEHCLSDSGAAVAIVDDGMLGAVREASGNALRCIVLAGGQPEVGDERILSLDAVIRDNAGGRPRGTPRGDDLGVLMYTGGTTGRPKGVMHTQRGLVLNLLSHLIETELRADDRLLLASPLPHSAGFLLQTALLRGATVIIERRFDVDRMIERIERDRVTYTFLVPTMIYRMLDAVEGRALDLTSLRTILYGAAPITRERLQQGLRLFGPVFVQLYGQSEVPNWATRLPREAHDPDRPELLASCGQPVTMARVRVVDPDSDDGTELPRGTVGEIAVRASYVMAGYRELPDATAKALRGGWLYTGDIGRMDEAGYVFLLDRRNDMIITGGMNVYSSEVESVIAEVDGVSRVAVVGVPHPDWGEAVTAFVVASDATEREDLVDAVTTRCRTVLSRYKVPKTVHVVASLPLTVYGKVDKVALRSGSHADPVSPAHAPPG